MAEDERTMSDTCLENEIRKWTIDYANAKESSKLVGPAHMLLHETLRMIASNREAFRKIETGLKSLAERMG